MRPKMAMVLLGGLVLAFVVGCEIDPNQVSIGGIPVLDALRERLAEVLARFTG